MRKLKLVLFVLLFSLASFGQEVIMNQPSADVVEKGHVLVRADEFYTQSPVFFQENLNVAVGVFKNFEVSVNSTNTFNRGTTPVSLVAGFKWAVYKNPYLTLFVGDQFSQPLTHKQFVGYSQGNLSYEAAALTFGKLRVTAGSFQSTNAVALGSKAGFLGGVELTVHKFKNNWVLTPGVDYASGSGTNGYTSLGLTAAKGNFFVCPGYMIANSPNPNGSHQSFLMMGYTF